VPFTALWPDALLGGAEDVYPKRETGSLLVRFRRVGTVVGPSNHAIPHQFPPHGKNRIEKRRMAHRPGIPFGRCSSRRSDIKGCKSAEAFFREMHEGYLYTQAICMTKRQPKQLWFRSSDERPSNASRVAPFCTHKGLASKLTSGLLEGRERRDSNPRPPA